MPERHKGLAPHRLADDRKGILPDRIVGGDVIGRIEEAPVVYSVTTAPTAIWLIAMRKSDVRASSSLLSTFQKSIFDMTASSSASFRSRR